MDTFVVIPSVKNFHKDQLNSRTLPVFPGGIKNSRWLPSISRISRSCRHPALCDW